jgi:selenoprotein W-related protein
MASGLKSELEREFPDSTVELLESGGGVFELRVEGELVFSKKKLDRFPEKGEARKLIHSFQSKSP